MRTLTITILVACVAVAVWQRVRSVELRDVESRNSVAISETQASEMNDTETRLEPEQIGEGISEEQFVKYVDSLWELKSLWEMIGEGSRKYNDDDGARDKTRFSIINNLQGYISKLSEAQLQSALKVWTAGEVVTDEILEADNGLGVFIANAVSGNPERTIRMMQSHPWESKKQAAHYVTGAFRAWVRKDPEGMLKWVKNTDVHPSLAKASAMWADAAGAVVDPSPKNVRKLLGHPQYDTKIWEYGISTNTEVTRGLRTQESRMQFFRSLHEVTEGTGGKPGILAGFVAPLAQRFPFSKLAHVADSVPSLRPREQFGFDGPYSSRGQPGSLRFEVACASRDATPQQRWDWLTSRYEDIPSGLLLRDLVMSWCGINHAETAAWARTLPPGEQRTDVAKAMAHFYNQNERFDLEGEWKKR